MSRLMIDIVVLLCGSALLLWWSRKPLRHPGSHGFYRFFAWEGILVLFILNHEPWGTKPFSAHQMASWLLMSLSIFLVYSGHRALRKQGTVNAERPGDALYDFEKTTVLVTSGIFKYIRHPMYASLLALAWGAYFQAPSAAGTLVVLITSLLLLRTASTDERECLAYFGQPYADYMQHTRRFLPYVF